MPRDLLASLKERAPVELASYALTAVMFVLLFAKPATLMFDAWWNDPNSGHGLLLAPLSLYFAWKSGVVEGSMPQRALGAAILIFAVLFRYAADLAAELFVMRGTKMRRDCFRVHTLVVRRRTKRDGEASHRARRLLAHERYD